MSRKWFWSRYLPWKFCTGMMFLLVLTETHLGGTLKIILPKTCELKNSVSFSLIFFPLREEEKGKTAFLIGIWKLPIWEYPVIKEVHRHHLLSAFCQKPVVLVNRKKWKNKKKLGNGLANPGCVVLAHHRSGRRNNHSEILDQRRNSLDLLKLLWSQINLRIHKS